MVSLLEEEKRHRDRHRTEKTPCDNRGRDGSSVAASERILRTVGKPLATRKRPERILPL